MSAEDPNPFIRAAVAEMLRKRIDHQERLLREHFADTPLALESVLRTGVLPWRVEVQTRERRMEFNEDGNAIRLRDDIRVMEYPRA